MSSEWMRRGACLNSDPDLFHSDYAGTQQLAKKVCNVTPCPVRDQCLAFALDHMDDADGDSASRAIGQYGVWGGTGPTERWRILGRRPSITERRAS